MFDVTISETESFRESAAYRPGDRAVLAEGLALALAVVAVGAEDNLRNFTNRWGFSPAVALRWLSYLAGAGHQLTDAEEQLMDDARGRLGADNDDTDGDE